MSHVNQSTAFLAAKAFLIATGIVTVGGVMFTWAVKTALGVENVKFPSFLFCILIYFILILVGSGVWSKDEIYIPDDSPRFKITIIHICQGVNETPKPTSRLVLGVLPVRNTRKQVFLFLLTLSTSS